MSWFCFFTVEMPSARELWHEKDFKKYTLKVEILLHILAWKHNDEPVEIVLRRGNRVWENDGGNESNQGTMKPPCTMDIC
jgi:hypothetical protein